MNPCGVGIGENIEAAWDKAYEADPVSIFGGIVALNDTVEKGLAEKLSKIFWRSSSHRTLHRKPWNLNA